jgi:CheY-like chemotaxis protein
VLLNLVVNARDAMPSGGTLIIETTNAVLDEAYGASHVAATPGEYVMLAVSDTGAGMDEHVKAHIFEPFFTTKEEGRGTGLGLSTVYGIVKQHAGYIWAYSEPGRGTTFKVYLPRSEATEAETPIPLPAAGPKTGTETILLVEDDRQVRQAAMRILRGAGYMVLVAASGQDAVVAATLHNGPIHLMLTDVVMPKMSGSDLARRVQALRPDIKVLYMSGYTDNAIVHHGLQKNTSFLAKPFSREALLSKVREVLDESGERTGA